MSLRNDRVPRKYYYVAMKAHYEELGDGLVRVTSEAGLSGVFHWSGRWVEGDLTQCNPHMAAWCAGPSTPPGFNYRWVEVPVDTTRPSGWPEELESALASRTARAPQPL